MDRSENGALISVKGLKTYFHTDEGVVPVVDGVDFSVMPGETLGIVGESGCGKSVTALSIMRLVPYPGRIVGGEIIFRGEDLLRKSEDEMRRIRGSEMAMVYQEPMASLNPVLTVGEQIMEALTVHRGMSKKEARQRSIELLDRVGIPSARSRVDDYPYHLSGGMRQRVMIAMALSCGPRLLIADEPTTALDVTVKAQILDLIKRMAAENGTAVILITHDLSVIAEAADRVVVMYAGKAVESADVKSLFGGAKHPYTRALMDSIPRLDDENNRLKAIDGVVPSLYNLPEGCPFHPRCEARTKHCTEWPPSETAVGTGHRVSCWLYGGEVAS